MTRDPADADDAFPDLDDLEDDLDDDDLDEEGDHDFEDDVADDALDDDLDADFPLGDGTAETDAEVFCPWCGEPVTIGVDPGGGEAQEYVEDCQVCCRPWTVHVTFDGEGQAHVQVDAAGDWDD